MRGESAACIPRLCSIHGTDLVDGRLDPGHLDDLSEVLQGTVTDANAPVDIRWVLVKVDA